MKPKPGIGRIDDLIAYCEERMRVWLEGDLSDRTFDIACNVATLQERRVALIALRNEIENGSLILEEAK
jgi:hypothetical protein